jgi:hypothetical protein
MWARYRDIFFDNWNKHQETKCFGYLSSNTKKFNLDDLAKGFLFHKYLIPLSAHSDFNLDQKTQYWKSIDSLLQNLDLLIEKTDYEIIKFTLNTAISHTEYFKKFDGKNYPEDEKCFYTVNNKSETEYLDSFYGLYVMTTSYLSGKIWFKRGYIINNRFN